ncbi:Bifunctional inhibitor/plant lipid transfer protein/seed storage helical domain - like 10 [Theobroma cacao]|nr:Bifunctional inhibitor/plant lipid transfer protein/seed storage helical domain - like 10 [Theobroma cacao]
MEGYAKIVLVAMVLGLAIGSEPFVANGQKVCGMSKEGFQACEPSVSSANPHPPPPSPACCMALNDADLQCFCFFKNSKMLNAYGIDFDRATALPVQCNLVKSFHC